MDRGAWWATVHGVAKSRAQLSDFTFTFTISHYYFLQYDWMIKLLDLLDQCQGAFSFKGSNMFSSFVCRFSRILCSLLVPGKQERAELHVVLGTETMRRGTCLDSLQ